MGACSPWGGGGGREGVPEASCSWVDDASTLASAGFSSGLCQLWGHSLPRDVASAVDQPFKH